MLTVFVIKSGENKNTTPMEVKRMLRQIDDGETHAHHYVYLFIILYLFIENSFKKNKQTGLVLMILKMFCLSFFLKF